VGRGGEYYVREKKEQNDNEKLKIFKQVAVTRLKTGYSRATQYNKF
jgi:hypothetical protein